MSAPVIAILNGNADLLELMKEALELDGYIVATALISEIRRGRQDLIKFMHDHEPAVVIYDVPPPFVENMNFFKLLRDTYTMHDQCIILTTTNQRALTEATGENSAMEILGKPFELHQLLAMIKEKSRACHRAA